jgi:endo-1,4-beta-xylanase
MIQRNVFAVLLLVSVVALAGAQAPMTLKDAYKGAFHIGAAINGAESTGSYARGAQIAAEQFDSITPENELKWERIHPQLDTYNFELADKYVEFGEKHHMFIVGHCLVWHSQVPSWVFEDEHGAPLTRDALLKRMHDHIATVVGRYKGRIKSWDVVNEALNDDGTMRQSKWQKIIGDDFIEKAFEYAHEADPAAELNYNDYSLENVAKRKGALELVKRLKAKGVPIAVVGIQAHDGLNWPADDVYDKLIPEFASLGVKVAITELDIDVLPPRTGGAADVALKVNRENKYDLYKDGLPDPVEQALAQRYAALFAVFLKHKDAMSRVTFWGVTDADSWLNNWPIFGRTSYPLLWDRAGKAKPAFDAVLKAAGKP